MAIIICIVAQKGGVGKSAIARSLGVIYTKAGWNTKIADLDPKQTTCVDWNKRRIDSNFLPDIAVQQYPNITAALRDAEHLDMMIFDAPPHSTSLTLEMAKRSDLVLIPVKTSLDDLNPNIILANDLKAKGIDVSKVAFVLSRINRGKTEIEKAKDYIRRGGYFVFENGIPERAGYEEALDLGLALTEAKNIHSRENAKIALQSIITHLEQFTM